MTVNARAAVMPTTDNRYDPIVERRKGIPLATAEGYESASPWQAPVDVHAAATSPSDVSSSEFGRLDAARFAARELVRKIPPAAKQAFYDEHQALVDKEFCDGLTRSETARLTFIRWQLDRIQDAEVGPELDRLEQLARFQESLAQEIKGFVDEVETLSSDWRNQKPRQRW